MLNTFCETVTNYDVAHFSIESNPYMMLQAIQVSPKVRSLLEEMVGEIVNSRERSLHFLFEGLSCNTIDVGEGDTLEQHEYANGLAKDEL